MDISLDNYKLIKLRKNSLNEVNFIRELFTDNEVISYLGHLENDFSNVYVVSDSEGNYIGYLSMSNIILNIKNLISITLYYAIDKKYRGMGYGTKLLNEVSDYLLNEVDMLVMMIDVNNKSSLKVAEKASFEVEFKSDEDVIYTKYSKIKKKQR